MGNKKSKATLESGDAIYKVYTRTSEGNLYEATAAEVANAATPSTAIGALTTSFTLEESSSPVLTLTNRGAAELYQTKMGGYMLLVSGGKVYAAKLNPSDWNYFADGTEVTDASLFETMVRVPTCKFIGDGKTIHFAGLTTVDGCSIFDAPQWVGAYKMYIDESGVGHSRPDVAPTHTQTVSAFQSAAQQNGSRWGQANYGFHCLINALYQARYGNLNSQETIGQGFSYDVDHTVCRDIPMGLTRSLGDGSGCVLYTNSAITDTDGNLIDQYPVKLFGFEDLWGKMYEFRPGIRFYLDDDGETRHATVYSGNVVSNTATGRDISGVPTSGGFVKSMVLDEYWDMIAEDISGGSSTTYYCDEFYGSTTGEQLAVGGDSTFGSISGISFVNTNAVFTHSSDNFGARLAYYGSATIVSGAELVAMTA